MKEKFYQKVITYRNYIVGGFVVLAVISLVTWKLVAVNYDINDYLPADSPSTVAIDVMNEEFGGGIPNARVLIYDVDIPMALKYKAQIEAIEGVEGVTWLDDSVNINQPLEIQNADVVETYYKDGNALYSVTVEEDYILTAVPAIRELIGEENALEGSAVSTEVATNSTVAEITVISIFTVVFVLIILMVTTNSWAEPFVVLIGLGVAIVLNAGSNLIFGEISFVTNAAGNILQLAVSLDYSVFLIHRFEEYRQENEPEEAMLKALCKSTSSILSSGLTTVIGFLALVLMRFGIGSDLGLALAKGIAISLIVVFVFMPGLILTTYKWMDKTKHRSFLPSFEGFGNLVNKIKMPVLAVFLALLIPAYLSSNHNAYYYGASKIFGEETRLGADTVKIEEIFGKNDSYVLLVPRGNMAAEVQLSEKLKKLNEVTSVISYVDMAGAEIPYEYLDENTLSLLESENYSRMVISLDTAYEGERTFELIENIRNIAEKYYPGEWYLAGAGVSTYDLMDTITQDMVKVNFVAIGAVFAVLLFTMKNIVLSAILVLTIEAAIWINLSFPYYMGNPLFYIAYLIISSIQLGATVDYAILFTERYRENREVYGKKESIVETVKNITASVLTSGSTLTVVGYLMFLVSSNGLLAQLGKLLGRGGICSLICVFFVLPGFLYFLDGMFMKKEKDTNLITQK